MIVTEFIELLLLRHRGGVGTAALGVFDRDDVTAVYLELILGWYLVEQTAVADPAHSDHVLDSIMVLTPKGIRRLEELESKVPPNVSQEISR